VVAKAIKPLKLSQLSPDGQRLHRLVHMHRSIGTASAPTLIPRVQYPHALEVSYANQLVGMITVAREATKPAMDQLGKLLDSARAARGDADDPSPSRQQWYAGLPVVVENPAGSVRRWTDEHDNTTGETRMHYAYGYIDGVRGADGEDVDCYLGPDENAPWVYIVRQLRPQQAEPDKGLGDRRGFDLQATRDLSACEPSAEELDQLRAIEAQFSWRSGGGVSAALEHAVDRAIANAKMARDAGNGGALSAEAKCFLDVPEARSSVLASMVGLLHDAKIRDVVVETVPVDMVNDLISRKTSPERALHDYAVLQALASAIVDEAIERVTTEPSNVSILARPAHEADHNSSSLPWVFDEQKIMLGFSSADIAKAAYLLQYDDPKFYGGMTVMSLDDFKAELAEHTGGMISHRDSAPRAWRMDAGEGARARALIEGARLRLTDAIHPNRVDAIATKFAKQTSDWQRMQLRRQAKAALGIDVTTTDTNIPALIEHFVSENVSLIKSFGNKTMDDVEKIVTRAITSGRQTEDVAKDIGDRFDIGERHARMIARDQIGKLNGQISATRHRELGLRRFIWRTVGDDRVRDEHTDLQEESESEPFEYGDPPDTDDGPAMPGEPILCRCSDEPVYADITDPSGEDDND
jgi:SPP1 gp7 family putative phage head morphogenesis protein